MVCTGGGALGPMRSTHAGPELEQQLRELAIELGPLPHARLDWSKRTKQTTRLIPLRCPVCSYPARVTRLWLQTVGPLLCPEHGEMVEAAQLDQQGV